MLTGQPAATEAEVAEEEPVAVQSEKVTATEEKETEAPKESEIMDGQLDSSKDENDKKAVGSIFGSIFGSETGTTDDDAPSESKLDDAAVVDKSEETETKEESDEEPKQVE